MRRQVLVVLSASLFLLACGAAEDDSAQGSGSGGASVVTGVPCEVAAILEAHCIQCHGSMPQHGAPLTLESATDFQAPRNGRTVGATAVDAIQSTVKPMPPPPNARLSAQDVATLQAWVGAGAMPVSNGCPVPDLPMSMMTGGTGVPPGSGGAPSVIVDSGAPHIQPVDAGSGSTPHHDTTSNWSMFGSDLSNSRNNAAETALSVESVKSLHMLWPFMGPATTSTPAVVDGVVYLPAWDGKVYALHVTDGSPLWTTTLPHLIDGSPAVTASQIFVGDNTGWLYALDRESGVMQWSTQVDTHAEAHLWGSPVYIEDAGLVVIGVASGEEAITPPYSFRGSVVGIDGKTGAVRWRFYTTDNDQKSGPGVAVWSTPAVDTTRKAVYIGTGNNYSDPPGPYEDSMLAIDYRTGALVWSKQFTADDVFTVLGGSGPDFDIGATPNLFAAGGKDLVGIGIKSGIYFALDRDSGSVVWMTEITTGSSLGGVISASAYADGRVFVASNRFQEGMTDTVALDASNGDVKWRQTAPMITYGGVAHANGVVYLGTTAGTVFALDAAAGTVLWMSDTPDAIAGSPAVSNGMLFVPWGYQWTLGRETSGTGGLIAYGL